jgi:hypothetical protein
MMLKRYKAAVATQTERASKNQRGVLRRAAVIGPYILFGEDAAVRSTVAVVNPGDVAVTSMRPDCP